MGLKKQQDEMSVQIVAQKYFKEFSPYVWLWVCRVVAWIWCYAYHDFESLFILFWLMHSTVVSDTKLFAKVTIYFYLPCFTSIFLFYYLINIPGLVNFDYMTTNILEW
jgi:hypothetical protein